MNNHNELFTNGCVGMDNAVTVEQPKISVFWKQVCKANESVKIEELGRGIIYER